MKPKTKLAIHWSGYLKICFCMLAMSSCTRAVYTSATYGAIKSYTPKQEYRGIDTSAVYISGSISTGGHQPIEGVKDRKTKLSAQILRSTTKKNYNLFYGAGISYGTYRFGSSFENVIRKNETKSFYSADAKLGFNLNLPAKRVDWRILGVEIAYNYEFGPFQNKLHDIKENTTAIVINKKSIFSYNINSEVVFKLSNLNAFGFGVFIGSLLDGSRQNSLNDSSSLGAFFSFKSKKFTFSYLVEDGWGLGENFSTHSFGVFYQLF